MTENEAIKFLTGYLDSVVYKEKCVEAHKLAINALEEVQRWHTSEINPKIKNVFANTSTQICHNCDHKDEYIEELEAEVEEYRTIGTPEECQAAVEKQTAKRALHQGCYDKNGEWHEWNGINGKPYELCPSCRVNLCCETSLDIKPKYCSNCGQKLDWSDAE